MLDKIATAIQQLGIEVEQMHGESAGGQFEVVTAHKEAMTVRNAPHVTNLEYNVQPCLSSLIDAVHMLITIRPLQPGCMSDAYHLAKCRDTAGRQLIPTDDGECGRHTHSCHDCADAMACAGG